MSSSHSFTVGKLDAGMAILLTSDHHLIEFPSILLPRNSHPGSVISLTVSQDGDAEQNSHSKFLKLQEDIREMFGRNGPAVPELRVRNVTQTSCVLEWDPIEIGSSKLKSLTLWRNVKTRLGSIPRPLQTTSTKLSGLSLETSYKFHLLLRTTSGTLRSNELEIKTHSLTNLSGIQICTGTLLPQQHQKLEALVEQAGCKPLQSNVRIDTTHFICSDTGGEQWEKAKAGNIPIVGLEWLEACVRFGRVLGVRVFYLDADPKLKEQFLGTVDLQARRESQVRRESSASGSWQEVKVTPPTPDQQNAAPKETEDSGPEKEANTSSAPVGSEEAHTSPGGEPNQNSETPEMKEQVGDSESLHKVATASVDPVAKQRDNEEASVDLVAKDDKQESVDLVAKEKDIEEASVEAVAEGPEDGKFDDVPI